MSNGKLDYIATITSQNVSDRYNEDIGFMDSPEGMSFADGTNFTSAEVSDIKTGINYQDLGDVNDIYAINDDNFYSATGRRSRRRATVRRAGSSVWGEVQKGLEARRKRRQTRVEGKAGRKQTEAQAQLEASKGIGAGAQADAELARSLGRSTEDGKKGLSTGAIVGIVLGGLAVVGVVAYMIIKKKGK